MIPARPKVPAQPNAGARYCAGKSCEPDAVLRKGLQPKPESVRTAVADAGAHARAVQKQVGSNGNPKKRDANEWGTGSKAAADAKELK